jgi:hypothetical protein
MALREMGARISPGSKSLGRCNSGAMTGRLLIGRFESLTFEGELLHTPAATLGRLVRNEWEFPLTGAHWPELVIESVLADPFA